MMHKSAIIDDHLIHFDYPVASVVLQFDLNRPLYKILDDRGIEPELSKLDVVQDLLAFFFPPLPL